MSVVSEPGELVEVSVGEFAKRQRAASHVVDLDTTGSPKRARVTLGLVARRNCARGGKRRLIRVTLPDGPVCSSCLENGTQVPRQLDRLRRPADASSDEDRPGQPCVHCAGITTSFRSAALNSGGRDDRGRYL